jgi:hypothetical protein
MRTTRIIAISTFLLLSGATWSAGAQNALGDGQALDANLDPASGGRNSVAPQADYRLRNLLVTGNVAGGRGFRGSVGYTASDDFRGIAGSDRFYRFERDSALSTIPYAAVGRLDSAIGFGQDLGLVEYRRQSTAPTTDVGTRAQLLEERRFAEYAEARARLDRVLEGTTTRGSYFDAIATPDTVAVYRNEAGEPVRVTSSFTRGVRALPLTQDATALGLSAYDQARLLEDTLSNRLTVQPGRAFTDIDEARQGASTVLPGGAESRVMPGVPRSYQEIAEAIEARLAAEGVGAAASGTRNAGLAAELARMRDFLAGTTLPTEDEEADVTPGATPLPLPGALPSGDLPSGVTTTQPGATTLPSLTGDSITSRLPAPPPRTPSEFRLPPELNVEMLRHGRKIDTLAPEGDERFAEMLRTAEGHLAARDFFLAEREFNRALRYQPNNPMAMAGLAFAQIGAGVQASAGVSVRRLFTKHPTLIDATWGDTLLPPQDRLDAAVAKVRQRAAEGRGGSDSALLLAFVGRQTNDRALMTEGLDLMTAADADDPLAAVLRTVWLESDSTENDPPAEGDGGEPQGTTPSAAAADDAPDK